MPADTYDHLFKKDDGTAPGAIEAVMMRTGREPRYSFRWSGANIAVSRRATLC
jgi:hypothetical protein